MYEGGIRVPTFMRWKNVIPAGSSTKNFGMLMDLLPTFSEIAGVEIPPEVDGISLLPTMQGKSQNSGDRVVFWVRREGGTYGGKAYYAVRQGDLKLLQNTPYEPELLFNMAEDEYEQSPIQDRRPDEFKNLKRQLQEHIRRTGSIPWQD